MAIACVLCLVAKHHMLLAAAVHRLALRGAGATAASVATILVCGLSFFVAYAYNYSPDAFAALPAVLALIALADGHALTAGLWGGVAFLAKPAHVLVLLVGGAVTGRFQGRRAAARFAAGAAPAVLLVLVYNALLFGGPFTFSYDRLVDPGSDVPISQRQDFQLVGAPARLEGQLLDPKLGLLFTAPAVLVSLAGLGVLWRRRRVLAVLSASVFAAYLLFFSLYVPWRASHFGNRFLFVLVAASALPLAGLLEVLWVRGLARLRRRRAADRA